MRMRILLISLTLVGLLVVPVSSQLTAGPTAILAPTIIYVPEEFHTGGAYTAIQAASDGRVYLGTTIYDGYAYLLGFTPGSGRFESLAEMSAATGERNPGPYAQAKIHTKPVIAPDGRVYFGTKSGKAAADARWQQLYPGGHLLVYDPRTRSTTDLGIIKPRVSIITVGFDVSRGLVYVLTDPDSHLVVFDPRRRTFTDRGQFGPPGDFPSRYLAVLANGDTFHQLGDHAMARYVAATGVIERLPLAITGAGQYEAPYTVAPASDGRRFFGVGRRSGQVYLFEPREREIGVRMLGAAIPDGYPPAGDHYTMTAAPDGAVYYTGMFGSEEGNRELFILRVGPEAGRPQIVGRVPSIPPAPPGYSRTHVPRVLIQGSTVTPDGTLIVMTAYPLRLLLFRGIGAR